MLVLTNNLYAFGFVRQKMLFNLRSLEMLALALLAGCAEVAKIPAPSPAQPATVRSEPVPDYVTAADHLAATPLKTERALTTTTTDHAAPTVAPRQPVKTTDRASKLPVPAVTPHTAPIPVAPGAPARPVSKIQSAAKAASSPVTVKQSPPEVTQQSITKPPEPTLDMTTLQSRLRETAAIGVFTKLALKNQVDTLLQQFRTHYQGGQKTSVTTLRQPYDLLVLKVLTLVQDDDPPLAKMIAGSREALWDILADPAKFKTVI